MTSSWPQNRNRYWSTMVWTMSSRWGRMASNLPRSPNSYCNKVGHQQMAKFLLSMQLSLLDSVTLKLANVFSLNNLELLPRAYLTKCWKIYLRTAKLVFGNRLISFPSSSTLMLRSGMTGNALNVNKEYRRNASMLTWYGFQLRHMVQL